MTGVAPDKTAILSLDTPAAGDDALRTVLGAPAGCKLQCQLSPKATNKAVSSARERNVIDIL